MHLHRRSAASASDTDTDLPRAAGRRAWLSGRPGRWTAARSALEGAQGTSDLSGDRPSSLPAASLREAGPELGSGVPPRVLVLVMLAAGAMIAQLVFGKAARDALFLSTFRVTSLPVA